jgi:hypothetical protein
MTWGHLHREEARSVGDEDLEPSDVCAPPCDQCGKKPRTDGRLCSDCAGDDGDTYSTNGRGEWPNK